MTKTSSLTLVAAAFVAVTTLAAPAFAVDHGDTSFNDDLVRATLNERGVDVIDLAEDSNRVRATVRLPDGSVEFRYFDINTLQPLGQSGDNTRVLSRLDVGAERLAPEGMHSLTWVDPDDLD